MKTFLAAILIASTVHAQTVTVNEDGFIEEGWDILRIEQTQADVDLQMGEDAWQFLSPAQKTILENYAKTCYRDYKGHIWTRYFEEQYQNRDREFIGGDAPCWYNLNEGWGKIYRPVAEDAEHISAQELLGAMINEEIKMVRFYRKRERVGGSIRVRVPNGTATRTGTGYNEYSGQSGTYQTTVQKYRTVTMGSSTYRYVWQTRNQSFPTKILEKKVLEKREENED